MTIYYLVPAVERPSWGMGIIYETVSILNRNGFNAVIIKEKNLAVPAWLDLKVSIKSYEYLYENIKQEDIFVVPEAMINFPKLKNTNCRKILFIQAGAYVFESMPKGEDHKSLGFQHVIIIMPHMESIVKNHIDLPFTTIPPYVADYFYEGNIAKKRNRQILIYPKFHQIDYSIVKYLCERHINKRRVNWLNNLLSDENWSLKELKGLSHRQVALEMKKSYFFISLNTFEALNTAVVEAMAAGCMVFCYEGFGPRDFLINKENAVVFGNNEAYQLVESLYDWIDNFEERQIEFDFVRAKAKETALNFTRDIAERKLIEFYKTVA